jgi:hypothetical protein
VEVHARGEDREDDKLEILEHGLVSVMEEQQREDIHPREKQTACIVEYVMLHQDGVDSVVGRPPALYSAYEREGHETKFKSNQEKKRYE